MKGSGPRLPDGCAFWLGAAAVFAALGGVGIAVAVTEYHPPWPSAWFIAGAVVCALGCACAAWALLLYLAHKEAGNHWCPDPPAHLRKAEQRKPAAPEPASRPRTAATGRPGAILAASAAASRGDLARWLRPALREMSGDLRQAAAGIEKAQREDSYAGVRHEFDLGQIWEDSRQRLAALQGQGDLYHALRYAYSRIARMHRIVSAAATTPQQSHDLPVALKAIRKAEAAVSKELAELGLAGWRRG